VTKSKHVINKYKDLVVKMQLKMNSKNIKIEELRAEKKKYKDQQRDLTTQI
jgi:predicted  nucleic acid-binding Zn-ribbon protein